MVSHMFKGGRVSAIKLKLMHMSLYTHTVLYIRFSKLGLLPLLLYLLKLSFQIDIYLAMSHLYQKSVLKV